MLDRIKDRLIGGARDIWRLWSVKIIAITFILSAAFEAATAAFPADVRAMVPYGEYLFPLGMALSLFARILKQSDRSGSGK